MLAAVDDKAIKALRRNKLTWDSWGLFKPYFQKISPATPDHSFREVVLAKEDAHAIQIFFLSIAWRVSASTLSDFQDVKLPAEVEENIRRSIVAPNEGDWRSFPVSLLQLTTQGEPHNHSPYLANKVIQGNGNGTDVQVPFMRIFLNGLIAHINYQGYPVEKALDGPLFLCGGDVLGVPGITYEASYQYENLLVAAMESLAPVEKFWKK